MLHSARKLLLDVSLACQEIMEFTEEKSYEEFQEDRLLQLAIEREFEIDRPAAELPNRYSIKFTRYENI